MSIWFSCWFAGVVLQRLLELRLARRNAALLKRLGGAEVPGDAYGRIVALHVAFLACLLGEFAARRPAFETWTLLPLGLFLLLQAARVWCIRTLGIYWNTRLVVLPGMKLVREGPYKWFKHPNYVIVTLEMLVLPLAFGCFYAAALFPPINAVLLRRRVAVEEEALRAASTQP